MLNEHGPHFAWFKENLVLRIIKQMDKYPKATKEWCTKPNSHILLDILDKYLTWEQNKTMKKVIGIILNAVICEHQHDEPYESRLEFLADELFRAFLRGEWQGRAGNTPCRSNWSEPTTLDTSHAEQLCDQLSNFITGVVQRVHMREVQGIDDQAIYDAMILASDLQEAIKGLSKQEAKKPTVQEVLDVVQAYI